MLVLTRKSNEAIQIGENNKIKVIGIEGDQVKLGISAPKSVEIHRKEIYLEIKEQNNEAANVSVDLFSMIKEREK
ncbi:carbon storage regulator CsrA [Oceanobacillus senegalensis]|uniref:carbon storage regulator CsrA n=1 Tax=Oceanobacillus senegalensis TaxID=1936063 RepID=UPI000A3044B7|nr:carbon storage regulator CsrA [Oceanobacillus senegalensis]